MIHHVYSDGMYERRNISVLGNPPVFKNDYEDIKYLLENTDHIFIFIITVFQNKRMRLYKEYGFEEFEIFKTPQPITNYNYPSDGRKLNIFILKGKGNIHDL